MGNIRSDTNGLRSDSEGASSHIIEVDPYRRSTKSNPTKQNPVKVSEVTFSRQVKTGVGLHWHTQQEFRDLSSKQKDEPIAWQRSNEVRAFIKKHWTIRSKIWKSDPDNYEKWN